MMTKTMKVEGSLHVVCQCDKCKAPPEQKPLAWMSPHIKDRDGDWVYDFSMYRDDYYMFPVYAAPPQRTWVGLTEDEIYRIAFELEGAHWKKIADAIEAKLKEKNSG